MLVVDPGTAPPWSSFANRVRWNYQIERYRSMWFLALTDEDIDKIFTVFKEAYSSKEIVIYNATAQFVRKNNIHNGLQSLHTLVKKYHSFVSVKESRLIYDLMNYEFFEALQNYKNSSDDSKILAYPAMNWLKAVEEKIHSAIPKESNKLDVKLSLNGNSPVVSTVKVADFLSVAQDGTLPSEVSVLIRKVHKKAETLKSWSIDDSSRHSISKISSEYLPNIVTSFVNVLNSGDRKSFDKVHKSAMKQLTVLADFLGSVEKSGVEGSVYEMTVQENFILEKFSDGGALQR